jgi:hypothetical protein
VDLQGPARAGAGESLIPTMRTPLLPPQFEALGQERLSDHEWGARQTPLWRLPGSTSEMKKGRGNLGS